MPFTITPGSDIAAATISGTLREQYTQEVDLQPTGPATAQQGDRWQITVGGTTRTSLGATAGETEGQQVDRIVTALAGLAGVSASRNVADHLVISSTTGAFLNIAPLVQLRADAATTTSTPFAANGFQLRDGSGNAHYTSAVVEFSGAWVAGEIWTVVVDNKTFTYPVPSAAVTPVASRTLRAIAQELINRIDADPTFKASFFDGTSAKIKVEDESGIDDPFAIEVRRGGGVVTGLFDIDGGGLVSGSVPVVVPLPGFPFFFVNDFVDYTARLSIEVLNPDGSAHPCTTLVGVDLGSTTTKAEARPWTSAPF